MSIQFQREEMMELLKDFYTLTKLRIVLFDDEFREITSWPGRHSTYCQLIRADSEAKNACNQCDLQACMKCRKSGKLYMYQCHAGLWETVVPLQYESVVIGYLMFGQVLMEGEQTREELWKQVEELPYLLDKAAFFRKKRVSRETFYAAAKIMEACASYLYLSRLIFRNSSAFRLHCYKCMHTGCAKRSLAPAGLGIPLQMQRDTSRDS